MADPADTSTTTPKKPGRRADKFTPAEVVFLKEMAQGSTQISAAQKAWPNQSYNSAAVTASETLKKPKIKDALEAAYQANGLTPQAIADVLRDAMLAKKTETDRDTGKLKESMLPDHSIRVTAARTAAQLIGAGKQEDPDKPTINFNFGAGAAPKNYVNES